MLIDFFREHYQFGERGFPSTELTIVILLVLYGYIVNTLFKFQITC